MAKIKMKYTNRSTKRCFVTIEPWADIYVVDPDQSVDVVSEEHNGTDDDLIEFEVMENLDVYIYTDQPFRLVLKHKDKMLPIIDQGRLNEYR